MKTNLLLFFIHRTGSSYIMQSFKCYKNVSVFGDYGEILTASEIKKTTYADELMLSDNQLEHYTANKLDGYLRFLNHKSSSDVNVICSKISLYQIKTIIHTPAFRKIIDNPNNKIVLLTRNMLDVFISLKKANQLNQWGWVNTSDIKLDINPTEFINWHSQMIDLYKSFTNLLHSLNKDYVVIDYDKFSILKSDFNKINYISLQIHKLDINLSINIHAINTLKFLVKQDIYSRHKDKINNFDELLVFLTKFNLTHLLKYK